MPSEIRETFSFAADVSRLGKERYVDFWLSRGEPWSRNVARFFLGLSASCTYGYSVSAREFLRRRDKPSEHSSHGVTADKSQNVHNHERSAACW